MTTLPVAGHVRALAEFASAVDVAAVPAAVRERATLVVLDTLGAALAATTRSEIADLARLARRGPASLLGRRARALAEDAALANGAAATMLELDEGHHGTLGHVAIHVVPAALALAEELGASGADLLAGVLAGYEVGARIARLGEVRPAMHPHATWGAAAGAVACARVAGAAPGETARALGIGASLGLVTSRRTIAAGATVKYALTGVAGELAVRAFRLARAGFTPEPDAPGSLFAVISESPRPATAALDGLGHGWEIERNYFKVHACCRYAAPAVDAVLEIRARRPLDRGGVAAIRVETFGKGARLAALRHHHELAARFSLPYCVAAAAVRGEAGVDAFTTGARADGRILDLAGRVEVVEDPRHTAAFPGATPARVTVRFADGTTEHAEVEHAVGDPGRPLAPAAIQEKFLQLASRAVPRRAAEAMLERVLRLERLERAAEVVGGGDLVRAGRASR